MPQADFYTFKKNDPENSPGLQMEAGVKALREKDTAASLKPHAVDDSSPAYVYPVQDRPPCRQGPRADCENFRHGCMTHALCMRC